MLLQLSSGKFMLDQVRTG